MTPFYLEDKMQTLTTGSIRVRIGDIICDVDYSYELEDEIEVNLDKVIGHNRR